MTTQPFHPGDRVLCTAAGGSSLEIGHEYTVEDASMAADGCPRVLVNGGSFFASRFRLAQPSALAGEFQKGDFVRGRTTAKSKHGADVSVQGWYREPGLDDGHCIIDFKQDGSGDFAAVRTETLVLVPRSPAQPEAYTPDDPKVGETWERGGDGAIITIGHIFQCGCVKERAGGLSGRYATRTDKDCVCGNLGRHRLIRRASAPAEKAPSSPFLEKLAAKKPDPYAEHARKPQPGYSDWAADQNRKHAALIAQHKADFGRPLRTPANRKAAERLKAAVAETLRSFPSHDSGAGWED